MEFSKKLIADILFLLWVATVGGLLLAACCIYTGSLPWLPAMAGLP